MVVVLHYYNVSRLLSTTISTNKTAGAICGHSLKNINGLNRSKNIKKGYSKFSIAFCGLLQRMMDFCKVRRILISCIDVIVRCPPGEQSAMRKPLGRAFFRLQCFCRGKNVKTQETVFCSCCLHLFQEFRLYINALFFCLKVVKIILFFIFICVLHIGNLKQKKIKIKLAQKFLNVNKLMLLAVEHVVSDTQGILYSFHHEFHNRFYRALLSKAR